MARLSCRPRHALRLVGGMALALLLAPATSRAASPDLATAVSEATAQLRQAWAADPTAAALPFPAVRLLPRGASVAGACTPKAPPRRPAPLAGDCAAKGEVLVDQDLLAEATERAPALPARAVAAYWIATALAERLLPPAEGGPAPKALATLQANCLAGVLLGARPARGAAADGTTLLATARTAYGDSYIRVVGSSSQRGYALLSGLGATASGCSSAEMAALAKGTVIDPTRLAEIEALPPQVRAYGSLMGAINSQCQPLPNRPCPRRIASSRAPRQ